MNKERHWCDEECLKTHRPELVEEELKAHFISKLQDPEIIREAAELGAQDQNSKYSQRQLIQLLREEIKRMKKEKRFGVGNNEMYAGFHAALSDFKKFLSTTEANLTVDK